MKPMREIAASLDGLKYEVSRVASAAERLIEIERERDHESEIERRAQEKMEAHLIAVANRIPDRGGR